MIYVGSAENADLDQVLDTVLVGPVPAGRHMFVFQVKSLGCALFIQFNIFQVLQAFSFSETDFYKTRHHHKSSVITFLN